MTPEQLDRVAHEVNRAYCAAIGDTSQSILGPEELAALRCQIAWIDDSRRKLRDRVFAAKAKTHSLAVPPGDAE